MDIIYVIEALCHAHDKQKVISEVYRVLRTGGRFIVIDGYFSKDSSKYTEDELKAVHLVAKSMMVTVDNQSYSYFLSLLKKQGFGIIKNTDYSTNILPSLRRLAAKAERFIEKPSAAKLINLIVGDIITGNAVAGYLMPYCVEHKLLNIDIQ